MNEGPTDPEVLEEVPTDPKALEEDLDAYQTDLDDVDTDIRELIDALGEQTDASLRLVVRYEGDDFDLVYVREDVSERYAPAELADRIEKLVFKGHADPPREQELYDYGGLDAVMRWYDGVIVAHFPVREWSGLVFSFDREESPIVDLAQQYLEDD